MKHKTDLQTVTENGLFSLKSKESYFTHSECDFCQAIAGERFDIEFKYSNKEKETFDASICVNCLNKIAN